MVAAINYPSVFLQSQKILHSFVVRQSDIRITYTYRRQLQRRVPCVLSVTDSHSVARKRGTRLSFSYILNLFNTKCDRVKQVVRPRTRVRAPQLSHNYPSPEWNPGKEFSGSFFGFPESLCTFVVRTGALRTYKVNTKHALRRCPLSASTCVVATSSQNSGATPLFVHIQTFDDKCELVSKVIRAKYYPDYNVQPTKRGKSINYSHEPLADYETLCTFVVRNGRGYTTTKDISVSCSKEFGRSLVALLPRVVVTVSQNREAAPFFYSYQLTYNAKRCQIGCSVQGTDYPTYYPTKRGKSYPFYGLSCISSTEAVKSKHLRIEELKAALRRNYGTSAVDSINDYLFTDIVNGGIRICMDMMQNMAEDEENEPTKFA